jgi:hypothetical protein
LVQERHEVVQGRPVAVGGVDLDRRSFKGDRVEGAEASHVGLGVAGARIGVRVTVLVPGAAAQAPPEGQPGVKPGVACTILP